MLEMYCGNSFASQIVMSVIKNLLKSDQNIVKINLILFH